MPLAGTVIALCISEVRGVQKMEVPQIEIVEGYGLANDAHGGDWHRQVSLIGYEKIQSFNARGANVANGDFGENIVVSGIDLSTLPVGTQLRLGAGAVLEVTQIGKECHRHCQIYERVGDCIMPREGIFARVITGGTVAKGNRVEVI